MSSDSDIEILVNTPSTSAVLTKAQTIQNVVNKQVANMMQVSENPSSLLSNKRLESNTVELPEGVVMSRNGDDLAYCTICETELGLLSLKAHMRTLTHQLNVKKKSDSTMFENDGISEKVEKPEGNHGATPSTSTDAQAPMEFDPVLLKVLSSPTRKKRPPNAYMIYSFIERQKILKECPDWSQPTLHKILGARWSKLTAEEKQPYLEQARKLRDSYEKLNPYGTVNNPIKKRRKQGNLLLNHPMTRMPNIPSVRPVVPSGPSMSHFQSPQLSRSTLTDSSSIMNPNMQSSHIWPRNSSGALRMSLSGQSSGFQSDPRIQNNKMTSAMMPTSQQRPMLPNSLLPPVRSISNQNATISSQSNASDGLISISSEPYNPMTNPMSRRTVKNEADCITLD